VWPCCVRVEPSKLPGPANFPLSHPSAATAASPENFWRPVRLSWAGAFLPSPRSPTAPAPCAPMRRHWIGRRQAGRTVHPLELCGVEIAACLEGGLGRVSGLFRTLAMRASLLTCLAARWLAVARSRCVDQAITPRGSGFCWPKPGRYRPLQPLIRAAASLI